MKFKLIILFLFISSCVQNYSRSNLKTPYTSKGFAYIYNQDDFENKIIKKELDNESLQIAHYTLKPGSLIRLTNLTTNETIVLKNSKRFDYPDFFKILITHPVAKKINLNKEFPLVEVTEVKKNKSFVVEKTKVYKEEERIHSNAPVETVQINNISKNKKTKNKAIKNKIYIIIGDFYSEESALNLKKRISEKLTDYDSKKLHIKRKKVNKISLLSGPYSSVNLMKNDYTQLKNFGFEELDISINE